MRKAIAAVAVGWALLAACTAGGPAPDPAASAPTSLTVAALKGPTGMGLAWMMSQPPTGAEPTETVFELSLHGSADEITPGLATGKLTLACLPVNLAAVLRARGVAIRLVAVNTLGVLHLVSKGLTVSTWADLAGHTVLATGKGATPEHVFDHLLERNGLSGQVRVEYFPEASEVAARLAAADSAIALLPEPYVTTVLSQDPELRLALDLSAEWDRVHPDSKLVTGALVALDALVRDQPEALAAFLAQYQASIAFTNAHPAAAGVAIAELGIVPTAEVAAAAIPRSHLTFLSGAEAEQAVRGYLQVLYQANPAAVGGELPDDDFYLP
ncbi:MAG: ABC transporter substrate-binding protein [Propionibacteriaceae bacterium]|jgi:NitT/TauT family transport system substrate-binding protein|nr:ABC transporter substrate-binding protein [Propionibacteriaceae bacterium]